MTNRLLQTGLLLIQTPIALAATTWYVNGANGSDGNNCKSPLTACRTIGHAISLAALGDSVMVAAGTYTENIVIGFSLNLIGSAARTTIIDGGHAQTVVTISSASADVGISNVTITNGSARYGGGINNNGTLTINSSTISGNLASVGCSYSFCSGEGGGILNTGTLTINDSTISGNSVSARCTLSCESYGYGGGIGNLGKLTMNNSTLSGNSVGVTCTAAPDPCYAEGGGILNFNGGALAINNSTISGNSTHVQCFKVYGQCRAYVGGIYNSQVLYAATIQNSIVSNNDGGNCYLIKSDGYNLSSDGTCYFDNVGDLNNTDPKLGPLQNNGGPTETMALSSGSPAIDAGNPSGCTDGLGHLLKTDQRGLPRPNTEDRSGCDMGAYETQSD